MADKSLYPVFDIPSIQTTGTDTERVARSSPLFDFSIGDFVCDGATRVAIVTESDAYAIWVLKILKTQEGACLSYMDIGIDSEGALTEPSRGAMQSALERTVTEALLRHPCTERVYNFEFEWEADSVNVSFTVKSKAWPAFNVKVSMP